jgi:hypothetical protein
MLWPTREQARRYIRLCFTPALAAKHHVVPAKVIDADDNVREGFTIVLRTK